MSHICSVLLRCQCYYTMLLYVLQCNDSRALLMVQGSVVDRHASEKEKLKDLPTYKDKDFLGDRRVLCVGSEIRQKLLSVFQADTEVTITFQCFNDVGLVRGKALSPVKISHFNGGTPFIIRRARGYAMFTWNMSIRMACA